MMNIKEMARDIGKNFIDAINGLDDMRVVAVGEADTVEGLIDCLNTFIAKDGSDCYLMGKQQNGFLVEVIEHRLFDGTLALDIRLTEKK